MKNQLGKASRWKCFTKGAKSFQIIQCTYVYYKFDMLERQICHNKNISSDD